MSSISNRKRTVLACAVLSLSLALSLLTFFHARGVEKARLRLTFERKAESYTAHIQRELYRSIGVIESIAGLYNSSVVVEREEFRRFVAGPLASHKEILALEWIPSVSDEERASFEQNAIKSGFNGFQFTERKEQGIMIRAGERARYYPVFYLEPFEGNEAALGYDLGSDPTRLKAIERSTRTGQTTSSSRITLVQETGDQVGFMILSPVFTRGTSLASAEDREKNLAGFTLGVFRIGDLIEKSLEDTRKEKIGFYIFDETSSPEKEFLYHHSADSGDKESEPLSDLSGQIQDKDHFVTTLDIPDRKWSIVFYPTATFKAAGVGSSWWILAGGLLFTSLLGGFYLYVAQHTRKVEKLMAELRSINESLNKEMLERGKVEENLQASLAEKEILLQEIHHRVKNNLQMVSGLLSLQARHIDNEKTRMIYLESESRVMSMALIHENLYRTKDLGRISFSDYVRDLSRNISSTYDRAKGKVEIFFEMEPASLVMDTAIPAGLVINELLTNAFQHAFPEDRDGMITIGFQVERENNYTLTVKDNGVGISVDRGLDGYSSLGLSLVKTLVELLGGQVEVSYQDGTIFTITFKEYLEAGTEIH